MPRAVGLTGRKVVVGVGGGIAAFKAVELVRELQRRGAEVRVMMTEAGARFVGPVTLAGLTAHPVVTDLWDPQYPGEAHVELSAWAEAIVIAPATANMLARASFGMADDVVLATLLCADCPVLYAPAMHPRMWSRKATHENIARLKHNGANFVGPVKGPLASGEEGMGRMSEPTEITDALGTLLERSGDLKGRTILVTAGPTVEDLDPVRFIGNRSTGKMGFAVAARAAARGAKVVLVAGPVTLDTPPRVTRIDVRSALEMATAVSEHVRKVDAVVMTAAVADYRAARVATEKLKKGGERLSIDLVQNPDILAGLGGSRENGKPVLVGFAVETQDVAAGARKKLVEKNVDLIFANHASDGFGGNDNEAILVDASGDQALPRMSKLALADVILDRVRDLVAQR